MFKRVMTIVICVLAVLFVVLLMDRLQDDKAVTPSLDPFGATSSERPPQKRGLGVGARVEVGEGNIEIEKKDDDGRLTHVIETVLKPEKGTGRARLVSPRISFYGGKGNEFRITAPHGWIDTEGVAVSKVDDIKRGALTGGVTLRDDRGTPDKEADDLVILMDECHYDQKLSRFHTVSDVTVRSPEAVITATGMHFDIRRDEEIKQARARGEKSLSRLRELRLLRNVDVVMYEGGKKLQFDLMPSDDAPKAKTPSPSASTSTDTPAGASDSKVDPRLAKAAAGKAPYQFILNGDVGITRVDGELQGADRVLLMIWLRDSFGKKKPPKPVNDVSVTGGDSGGSATETPPPEPGAGAPAEDEGPPIHIVCAGPLVIAPMSLAEKDKDKLPVESRVEAEGKALVLKNDKATATAQKLVFNYDGVGSDGSLTSETGDIMVALSDGRITIVSRGMTFRRDPRQSDSGNVTFTGPGRIDAAVSGSGLGLVQSDNREPFVGTWQKKMSATFGKYPEFDLSGKPVTDDAGEQVLKDYLRQAVFEGRSVLRQGEASLSARKIDVLLFAPELVKPKEGVDPQTGEKYKPRSRQALRHLVATGNVAVEQPKKTDGLAVGTMTCQSLDFEFRKTAEPGKSRPKKLIATGDVVAVHDDGFIECQSLDADFTPDIKKPHRDRIAKMDAAGTVRVRQKQADGQVLYAEGRTMAFTEHRVAEAGVLVSKTELTLTGTPLAEATAHYGPHRITGQSIWFDERTTEARVTGAGTLRLMSDQGMDGEKLAEMKPINIRWADEMTIKQYEEFPGQRIARFKGKVRSRAENSTVDSDDLWVYLKEIKEPKAPKATKSKGPGVLSEKLEPTQITATGHVTATSIDVPAKVTEPATVATITGDMLEYQAGPRAALVNGKGTLRIRELPRGQLALSPHLWKPTSTTTVTWKRKMVFHRQRELAWFGEDVAVKIEGKPTNLSGFGADFEGSGKTTLSCQVLMLFLEKADKAGQPATGGDPLARSKLRVREATATGGPHPPWVSKVSAVEFRDGDHYGKGESMTYTRADPKTDTERKGDTIELRGSPARVEQQSEAEPMKSEARRFRYWPTSGRFEILEPWTIEGRPGKAIDPRP